MCCLVIEDCSNLSAAVRLVENKGTIVNFEEFEKTVETLRGGGRSLLKKHLRLLKMGLKKERVEWRGRENLDLKYFDWFQEFQPP